jgi:hypothetical protein
MRGRNSSFSALRNSFIIEGSILQVTVREIIDCLLIERFAITTPGRENQVVGFAARTLVPNE